MGGIEKLLPVATRLVLAGLLVAAGILVLLGRGEWAARVGSLLTAASLTSAYLRSLGGVWNPKNGIPATFGYYSNEAAKEYRPSHKQISEYQQTIRGLRGEFLGAILGTLINGFGVWAASFFS